MASFSWSSVLSLNLILLVGIRSCSADKPLEDQKTRHSQNIESSDQPGNLNINLNVFMMGSPSIKIENSTNLDIGISNNIESAQVLNVPQPNSNELSTMTVSPKPSTQSSTTTTTPRFLTTAAKEVATLSTSTASPKIPTSTKRGPLKPKSTTKKPTTLRPKIHSPTSQNKNNPSPTTKKRPSSTTRAPKPQFHQTSIQPSTKALTSTTQSPTSKVPHIDGSCIGHCPRDYMNPVVYLSHTDCNKFCQCNFGFPIVRSCGEGLHFNPRYWVCDYPRHAECTQRRALAVDI